MFELKFIFVACSLFFDKLCLCKKYTNYTLYRGMPINEQHLEFFKNLTDMDEVNFWRPPSTVNRPVEFVIPPEMKETFLIDAQIKGIYLTTIIPELQSAFEKQLVRSYIRRKMASFDWRSYFRLRDIYGWLKDLAKQYPDEMKLFSIGKTYENRDIMAVKIVLRGSKRRSTVIVEGGIHAREWISPAFVTYMLHQILQAPVSNNKELQRVAYTYDWYFVPTLNPDGYEYSHTQDRLWRKNRRESTGVDINRNFDIRFGSIGVNRHKNSDIYCGSSAFSENESKAMAALVKLKSANLEYFLGFHSYGQYMILPYAHSKSHMENYNEVKNIGLQAARNISRRYGTKYTVGTAYDTVGYMTSGVSGCWVKKAYKVPYVLTFELRDNGQDGFALPAKQILPTCLETMDGVVSILTPRSSKFQKLKLGKTLPLNGEKAIISSRIVIMFNVLFFIIIRF